MADADLHRQGVALYRALVRMMPEGSDRLEMNIHDIVTKGGASRAFVVDGEVNDNAIKQAWRYLASIGAVENLGPRFKRPVKDPNEVAPQDGASDSGRGRATKAAGGRKAAGRKATGRKATARKATARKATGRKTTRRRQPARSRPARRTAAS